MDPFLDLAFRLVLLLVTISSKEPSHWLQMLTDTALGGRRLGTDALFLPKALLTVTLVPSLQWDTCTCM